MPTHGLDGHEFGVRTFQVSSFPPQLSILNCLLDTLQALRRSILPCLYVCCYTKMLGRTSESDFQGRVGHEFLRPRMRSRLRSFRECHQNAPQILRPPMVWKNCTIHDEVHDGWNFSFISGDILVGCGVASVGLD